MYATTAIIKNSKLSGRIVGTHQQLDKAARRVLQPILDLSSSYFPSESAILYFEGARGPDGLKRKSPETDEPTHFWIPDHDDGKMLTQIKNYQHNLAIALRDCNNFRAAFEAAWLAHFIADSLTPAHHFPLSDIKEDLMTNKEFVKFFGEPIKGIMHGNSAKETLKNNWKYYGAGGHMNKHLAFEYRIARMVATMPIQKLEPVVAEADLQFEDYDQVISSAVQEVFSHQLYDEFCLIGWTPRVEREIRDYLLPLIVKQIILSWYAALRQVGIVEKSCSGAELESSGR